MFGVVRALETNTLPWTQRFAPKGVVPMPIFEVATRVRRFEVPETFTFVVKMLDATTAFEAEVFAKVRTEKIEAPDTVTLVAKMLEAVKALETNTFPCT